MRSHLPAGLLPGPQSHRGSPLEDKAPPQEVRRSNEGGAHRDDGPSIGSCECPGRKGVLRALWLPNTGAATMKGAVSITRTLYARLSLSRSGPGFSSSDVPASAAGNSRVSC